MKRLKRHSTGLPPATRGAVPDSRRRGHAAFLPAGVLVSVVLHVWTLGLVSPHKAPVGPTATTILIRNDIAGESPPPPKKDLEPIVETLIEEPEEDRPAEQTAPPGETEDLGEDSREVAAEDESPLDSMEDPVPEEEALIPEDVFGVDPDSLLSDGLFAVRVGNQLMMAPGRVVSADSVPPRAGARVGRKRPRAQSASTDLQAPPDLPEIPDPPKNEASPLPKEDIQPPVVPPLPEKKVHRVVKTIPEKKYRTRVTPGYTSMAEDAMIEGVVVVDVWVGPDGRPLRTRLHKGLGYGLDEQAIQAAMASTFNPTLEDGVPAWESHYRLPYRFNLPE